MNDQRMRLPWITRMSRMISATTSKMWMKPPKVELVTSPRIQRTMRMIAMVANIRLDRYLVRLEHSRGGALRDSTSRIFDVFAGFLHVFSEATDRAAAGAKQCEKCG